MATVRAARSIDIVAIVEIHEESFAGFFLTSLGSRFLARFYRSLIAEPDCICLIALENEEVIGFAVGPTDPDGFFRKLFVRKGLLFALDAAPALLANPVDVGIQLLRAVRFRGERPAQMPQAALLSSIAVRPKAAGAGVAGQLLEEFCRGAGRSGCQSVYLTTDRENNAAVNRFYVKHGFEIESVIHRPNGRSMNRYVRSTSYSDLSASALRGERHG